jgi:hypothetical protein
MFWAFEYSFNRNWIGHAAFLPVRYTVSIVDGITSLNWSHDVLRDPILQSV